MIWLVVTLIAVAVTAAFLVRARYWPYGPCPRCRDRGGHGWASTSEAYNRCRVCGGSRERIRPLALIWGVHREEARRLREKRRG